MVRNHGTGPGGFPHSNPCQACEKRCRLAEERIFPRLHPGQSRRLVCADSDEHNEYCHITEKIQGMAALMMKKHLARRFVSRGSRGSNSRK
ncbi:MAG: hypothetical protein ABIM40_03165 [Pseudomonadota bacterium]